MSKHIARLVTVVNLIACAITGVMIAAAAPAQAATSVRVESQITAHDLPYLNSPYISGSTLYAGQYAPIECQTRGREYIGDTVAWYRINSMYYPAYAFAPTSNIVPCGVLTSVPLAANGYSSPSFSSAAAEGWFDSNESVRVLCTAAGQTYNGSDAWFFTKGYWLHSSRLKDNPNGNGYSTCRGYYPPGGLRNDYPYSGQTSGVDPWGFYKGQCTSFVAWRLNDRNNIAFDNYYRGVHWGNAYNWDNAARSAGITVNNTPTVGAVAQTDDGSGHVAWVAAVHSDGTVTVEEYNYNNPGAYGYRRVSSSRFVYLHFPQA
jgi:surface antigen